MNFMGNKSNQTEINAYVKWTILLWVSFYMVLPIAAQNCNLSTPSFVINLTGDPDSVWVSPNTSRGGNCCATNNCVSFTVTIDTNASGLKLDIISGAMPGGALTYSINCGATYNIGQEICLNGTGPHQITFCKPGGNANVYRITSVAKTYISGQLIINNGCIAHVAASGYVENTLHWESVPYNTTYNSYLNCDTACDSVSITPGLNHPDTVVYRVYGNVSGACSNSYSCDTFAIRFVSNTLANITPETPTICYGDGFISLIANASGGIAPYSYLWNTNATNSNINATAGTYSVAIRDSLNCMVARDTVIVTEYLSPITAFAGNDSSICSNKQAQLNGSVQAAGGGLWTGGNGTFNPSATTLNAVYIPSAAEKLSGTVTLYLLTTGNGSCIGDTDTYILTIYGAPNTSLNISNAACANQNSVYFVNSIPGALNLWNVTGGTILGNNTDTMVLIQWGNAGIGNVQIRQTFFNGCDSLDTENITLYDKPANHPIIHE